MPRKPTYHCARCGYAWQPQSEVPNIVNYYALAPLQRGVPELRHDCYRVLQQGHEALSLSVVPDAEYDVMAWIRGALERERWYTLAPDPWGEGSAEATSLTIPCTFTVGLNWSGTPGREFKRFPTRADVDALVRELMEKAHAAA